MPILPLVINRTSMSSTALSLLQELMRQYNQERNTQFTQEEFEQMLYFLPMLMVAVSDMTVDGIEMGYLTGIMAEQTLVQNADASREPEHLDLLNAYLAEMRYLLAHMDSWEDQVLLVLRELLAQHPEQRNRVRLRMQALAMASRGVNVYEQAKIEAIAQRIGMTA